MTTEQNGGPEDAELGWLLKRLVDRVEGVREVALLSTDGIVKAAIGRSRDDSDKFAAIASQLISLARTTGRTFDGSDTVRLAVLELDSSTVYARGAGERSVLAVLAERDAKPSLVGHEMDELIKGVRGFLTTPARPSPAGHETQGG